MNVRLKEIRTLKHMNQQDFAKSLGIGQSTLAMMEVGKREITERHIKTICAIYGVDESWFRTGDGEPFRQDTVSILDRIAAEYKLSDRECAVVSAFLELETNDRAAIMRYVDDLVEKFSSLKAEHKPTADEITRESELQDEKEQQERLQVFQDSGSSNARLA